jgi:hypothetical protein
MTAQGRIACQLDLRTESEFAVDLSGQCEHRYQNEVIRLAHTKPCRRGCSRAQGVKAGYRELAAEADTLDDRMGFAIRLLPSHR